MTLCKENQTLNLQIKFKWSPKVELNEGLNKTISYFKEIKIHEKNNKTIILLPVYEDSDS